MKYETEKPIKLLIVDDSIIIRKAVKTLLSPFDELQLVGECEDGDTVCDFISNNDVDVVLMDVSMPKMNGIVATKLIRESFPDIGIIGYSAHSEKYFNHKMLEAGADLFVLKDTDISNLRNLILSLSIKRD